MFYAINNQNGLDSPSFEEVEDLQEWLDLNGEAEMEWDCYDAATGEIVRFQCAFHTGYIPYGPYEGLEEWSCEEEVSWPGSYCEAHND